jgi:urease accessory protein
MLHISDTFYPTGAYAHSLGLEGLAQEGVIRDRETLRRFLLEAALPPLARTDLPIAGWTWDAAGEPPDLERLRSLSLLASALRGARELREASEAIGRQRLELAARLHGGVARTVAGRAAAEGWPQPACVAAAIEGRVLGAPREAVLVGLIYATAAGVLAAAVKLLRLGQNAVHTLLAEALARAPTLVESARGVGPGDIGSCNPWWDIASARHERADFRLFIS